MSDGKSTQIPVVLLADIGECECEEAVVAVKLEMPTPTRLFEDSAWEGTRFPCRAGKTLGADSSMAMIITTVNA